MEHSTTLYERDCLTEGIFIILETSTGDESTEKLKGTVIAARFSNDLQLRTIYNPCVYSLELNPQEFEIFDSHDEIINRRIEGFQQWTNSSIYEVMSNIYKQCLKEMDLDIKKSDLVDNKEYMDRMEKAFGKDESNWDMIPFDKKAYLKYKEFFDKIEKYITDYKELKETIKSFQK